MFELKLVAGMAIFPRLSRFGKTAGHDRLAYRDYQKKIGNYYLQHYVQPLANGKKIIDIGCAEGGLLEVFSQAGFACTGLEYSQHRIDYAQKNSPDNIEFILGDIETQTLPDKYNVILMLDVIEHIKKKTDVLQMLKIALLPDGILIISFPPFKSAFGGHQQVMSSFLKFIPFLHLLPAQLYLWLLEHIEKKNVQSHFCNYQTGITMQRFEKKISLAGLVIKQKMLFWVRPRQAFRFGIKIRENHCQILCEYLSSGATYILQQK